MRNTLIKEISFSNRVNAARLHGNIEELGNIGKAPDGGLYRQAFSENNIKGRHWFKSKALAAGLAYSEDGAGNMQVRLEGRDPQAPILLIGSHLDTVPCGGRFDGAFGVLSGLECLVVLKEAGIVPGRPIEVISFTDEEGRFGGLLGSSAFTGVLKQQDIDNSIDCNGVPLTLAMDEAGYNANNILSAKRAEGSVHAYLEVHIEQSERLRETKTDIGIVNVIAGLSRWVLKLHGVSNHAGTTFMHKRTDAFQGLVEIASKVEDIIGRFGSENSVATIGRVNIQPNVMNIIPGEVEFSLEFRDPSSDILKSLSKGFGDLIYSVSQKRNLKFEKNVFSNFEPTVFDEGIIKLIEEEADSLGYSHSRMHTGAIHDAQKVAAIAPSALIFIPSENGISHSPEEWSDPEEVEKGANLLLNTVCRLAV